jgi:hypothetical protein
MLGSNKKRASIKQPLLETAVSTDDVELVLRVVKAVLPAGELSIQHLCDGEVVTDRVNRKEALRIRFCEVLVIDGGMTSPVRGSEIGKQLTKIKGAIPSKWVC